MYLHLGQDTIIHTKDLIGIFDLDNSTISHHTRYYLACAEKAKRVVNVSTELPKSFVVCSGEDHKITVYLSQISPSTLRKRAQFLHGLPLPGKEGSL